VTGVSQTPWACPGVSGVAAIVVTDHTAQRSLILYSSKLHPSSKPRGRIREVTRVVSASSRYIKDCVRRLAEVRLRIDKSDATRVVKGGPGAYFQSPTYQAGWLDGNGGL
jgi:hypothetical protein